jgi:hypothetical protein
MAGESGLYRADSAIVRGILKTASQDISDAGRVPGAAYRRGPLPSLTVGETLTHTDNLDGGPRLAGRGLDVALVERLGRGPMRQTSKSANTGRSASARSSAGSLVLDPSCR